MRLGDAHVWRVGVHTFSLHKHAAPSHVSTIYRDIAQIPVNLTLDHVNVRATRHAHAVVRVFGNVAPLDEDVNLLGGFFVFEVIRV